MSFLNDIDIGKHISAIEYLMNTYVFLLNKI